METIALIALAILLGGSPVEDKKKDEKTNTKAKQETYNASATRLTDIIHTDLSVRFDWEKQYLHGEAKITAKPYFKTTDQIILDAKGFDIHSVTKEGKPLDYTYEKEKLTIKFNKKYTKDENYTVKIKYTAKPNELKLVGSAAITDAKGLYFINPLAEGDKPQQIWTQGETESSSCWFPTIDKPNERMTQNIAITVQDKYTTLSNGLLVKSEKHTNGTRTDYWEQSLGHTPYLAMMAIGEFKITTDKWRGIDVDYYLEEDYHKYARGIFGRTPEMIEYYSEVLGVDYPWEKYAQVVVRDFVSGAMENTTAVIHGEFVQMDEREMLDRHEEDIIAHELIHHWFGDLVTCENWANLPLNESFATYGEYMWREKGFGRMAADKHLDSDLKNYLRESKRKQEDMIRFDYSDKEDMFDNHSYAKGGRILHMLRYYLGDEAFYAGLQKYLKDNAFSTVEIHQLRLAMEDVCGEDLNWFFNQWFLASGHPILSFNYNYNKEKGQLIITTEQKQDLTKTPLYKLPVFVDIYSDGKIDRHTIIIEDGRHEFFFKLPTEPQNVNIDAEHVLLAEIEDNKPKDWWLSQLKSPLYIDQKFVLENLQGKELEEAIKINLKHSFWGVRDLAVQAIEKTENPNIFNQTLVDMLHKEEKTIVKASVIDILSNLENPKQYEDLFINFTKEMSYAVSGSGLNALIKTNEKKALSIARKFENSAKNELEEAIMRAYSLLGEEQEEEYFSNKLKKSSNYDLYITAAFFTQFLKNQKIEVALRGAPKIIEATKNGPSWAGEYFVKMVEHIAKHHINQSENPKKAEEQFNKILKKENKL